MDAIGGELPWRSARRKAALEFHEDLAKDEQRLGLAPGTLLRAVLETEAAERDRDFGETGNDVPDEWRGRWQRRGRPPRSCPVAPTTRRWVVELWVRGADEPFIDRVFEMAEGTAADIIARSHIHPRARQIVAAHRQGTPPARISRDLHCGISTIYHLLDLLGERPNVQRDRRSISQRRHTIVKLYRNLRGTNEARIYEQIAARLDIDVETVRASLQYARRKGELADAPLMRKPPRRKGRGPAA